MEFSSTVTRSQPIVLSASTEAKTYMLVALALGLTLVGVMIGGAFADVLLGTGVNLILLFVELAIIFSSRWWIERSPLNIFLFAAFPLLSGITITPYILYVLASYVNGASILMNALASTTFMAIAAAVFARTTRWNLSMMGRALFLSVIGLVCFGILQIIFPALRTGAAELFISGAGVVIFALFTAYDMQRVMAMGRVGANPFLLALSLYLDLFNLFLYVLRFMLALSGNRRRF